MSEQRARLEKTGDEIGAGKLRDSMETLASGLHRDLQLESVLRRRAPELGLRVERDRSVGRELERTLERTRDRGMSL